MTGVPNNIGIAEHTKEYTYYLDSIYHFDTFCAILPIKPRLTALEHPSVILVRQTVSTVNCFKLYAILAQNAPF